MKSKMKKGFTLTELVIVIAVIAILAAVLIPTYTAIVRKANISADTQLCKNMNTALSAESDVENMQQVVDILEDAGYGIGKFNPTTEDYRFVWDATSNQILLLDENMKVVSHAKSYDTENWELWLTVKNSKEVITSKKVNFNYFLAYDYNGSIKITTLSSFATGDNTLNGNVTLETVKNGEATVSGNITGTLTVNAPNATINQYGTTDNVNVVAVSNNTFNVYGYVSKLTLTQGRVVTQQASYTSEVVIAGGNAKVENNSIIGKVSVSTGVTISNTNFDNTSGYVSVLPTGTTVENPENYTSQISNYAQLCAFRDAVNKGATYAGITVQLTSDIALEDGWTPIGNFARKTDVQSFAGTFDGNNKTISNLNNIGYSPINTFENSSTIPGKKEYTYGFFGVVSGATVKNVKLTGVNINIPTGATVYGDKVGALIGYSSGKLVVDNVTVSGSVSAYDGVGGIIGGAYSAKDQVAEFVDKAKKDPIMDIVLRNCVNNAQVTGCEKASGIIGYTKGFNILLEDCTNNGAISAGYAKKTENNGCYAAGMVIYGTTALNIVLTNCVSAGNITVSYNINDGEKSNKGVNHYTICNKNGDNYRYVTSKNNCNGTGTLTLNTVVVTENPEDTKAESSK